MIHYIALYNLKQSADDTVIEEMIRLSRRCFFRLDEVRNLRSGRRVEEDTRQQAFFLSADFENLGKLGMFRDDPQFARFHAGLVDQHTTKREELIYETSPGADPKYS